MAQTLYRHMKSIAIFKETAESNGAAFKTFVDRVVQATAGKRFSRLDEKHLQDGLNQCFVVAGMKPSREFELGRGEQSPDESGLLSVAANDLDRPDFFFFDGGFVVECKVDGGFNSHLRQCHRYAAHSCVNGVLLIAMRPYDMPESLCGKPVACLNFALKCL